MDAKLSFKSASGKSNEKVCDSRLEIVKAITRSGFAFIGLKKIITFTVNNADNMESEW